MPNVNDTSEDLRSAHQKSVAARNTLIYFLLFYSSLAALFWGLRNHDFATHLSGSVLFIVLLSIPGRMFRNKLADLVFSTVFGLSIGVVWSWIIFVVLDIDALHTYSFVSASLACGTVFALAWCSHHLIKRFSKQPSVRFLFSQGTNEKSPQ